MSARPSQSAHSKDNTFPLLRKIIADYKHKARQQSIRGAFDYAASGSKEVDPTVPVTLDFLDFR